jgi:hypothetical protein
LLKVIRVSPTLHAADGFAPTATLYTVACRVDRHAVNGPGFAPATAATSALVVAIIATAAPVAKSSRARARTRWNDILEPPAWWIGR